jgi:hypothetical protein
MSEEERHTAQLFGRGKDELCLYRRAVPCDVLVRGDLLFFEGFFATDQGSEDANGGDEGTDKKGHVEAVYEGLL